MTLIRFQCPHCEALDRPSPLEGDGTCPRCGNVYSLEHLHAYVEVPDDEFHIYRVMNTMSIEELRELYVDLYESTLDTRNAYREIMAAIEVEPPSEFSIEYVVDKILDHAAATKAMQEQLRTALETLEKLSPPGTRAAQ